MERHIYNGLNKWKDSPKRKPLIQNVTKRKNNVLKCLFVLKS